VDRLRGLQGDRVLEHDGGEQPGRAEVAPPASPFVAVGAVTLVALVAALAVLGWAHLRPDAEAAAGPEPLDEEVPTALAGGEPLGEVPPALAAAFDEPVVAARLLDEVPDDFGGCGFEEITWAEGHPELELAVLSPDGLYVSMVGTGAWGQGAMDGPMPMPEPVPGERPADEPAFEVDPSISDADIDVPDADIDDREIDRFRVTCHATWERGGWTGGSGSSGPAFGDIPDLGTGGATCCDGDGLSTGQTVVQAPEGAAWVLQERGGWWLAYPLDERRIASVTWKFREGRFGGGMPATHVLYLDEVGEVIDEAWVGN
jgi:hypothetical protein